MILELLLLHEEFIPLYIKVLNLVIHIVLYRTVLKSFRKTRDDVFRSSQKHIMLTKRRERKDSD